ncbi:MAG: hypothetical protein HYS13_07380, partial [Planctomycetia bacterium]|nr:hypothetical protein [Planctomycetia bacterium]
MAHENGTATAGGAPPGNSNAIRHGLTCAALPKGAGHVRVVTLNLRREIENAIMEARGEVSLYDACIVQTAVRWERVALLASLWLRREAMLTPDQRLNFSREVARASGERDKCLRLLGLHAKERQGAIDA